MNRLISTFVVNDTSATWDGACCFANNVVLDGGNQEEKWREPLQSKKLRISRVSVIMDFEFYLKLKVLIVNIFREVMQKNNDKVSEVESYKFLETVLQKSVGLNVDG